MYSLEWSASENGKNITLIFFLQKSKFKLFHGRTHGKSAVKYINMTKQELGRKLQIPLSRYNE